MDFDMVIVGGGPAGLSCAIRAKQIDPNLSVCVVDKGSEIGSHILSGNVFEPRALFELFPDWQSRGAPVTVSVTEDNFYLLPNQKSRISIPHFVFPKELSNQGNYIISLGELCKWLSNEAEQLGVEVYPGFAVSEPLVDSNNSVVGVRLVDTGIAKDKSHKPTYSLGMDLRAKRTILAEGARGSVTEKVIEKFDLRKTSVSPPTFSLGLKEVWQIDPAKHKQGSVNHSVGYPISGINDISTYSGAFLYHMDNSLVHLGLVVGLDYTNANLNLYNSFQNFKTHSWVKDLLAGGKCISYGARVLNVGGFQALPQMQFPGGLIVGCAAGTLNLAKIKGTHTAMKSGMLAAEHTCGSFDDTVRNSWVGNELWRVRNMKPAFKKAGMLGGLAYGGIGLNFFRGKEPWTWKWTGRDCDKTKPLSESKPIDYSSKPDGVLTFDILDNLARTGVKHEHDQPSHLRVKKRDVPLSVSLPVFGGPEAKFCPAKVYEYPEKDKLVINAQNCIHCKCCSIKATDEFIEWTVPEGGGGPQYSGM